MRSGLLVTLALIAASPACGQERDPLAPIPDGNRNVAVAPADGSFDAYKFHLTTRARSEGVSERSIQAVIPGLVANDRVIRLDRSQPGGTPGVSSGTPDYEPYRVKHVTNDIIRRGRDKYREHWNGLYRLQQETGVDPAVVLAIYGKETSYGRITGNFDLFESLGTLAWEGRRRQLFEDEFIAALKLLDHGYTRAHLKGSWAGAAGKTQFMPSNILLLAADGDGDGFADIWNSEPDAFRSIANYLVNAGWERDVPWGIAVRVPTSLNRASIKSPLTPPRCPAVYNRHSRWLPMAEWRRMGLVPIGQALPDDMLATLLEPDGEGRTAYLLTQNYRAILDYNCSNFYALTIGLVADAVRIG